MALPAPSPRDQRTTALRNDAVRCAAHELVRCGRSAISLRLRKWPLYASPASNAPGFKARLSLTEKPVMRCSEANTSNTFSLFGARKT